MRQVFSNSSFSPAALAIMHDTRALMTQDKLERYAKESIKLRQNFIVSSSLDKPSVSLLI